MKNDYSHIKGLADIYLEDSFVLSISEAPNEIAFALDAVLTPANPQYQPPKPDEQYCYARGTLIFEDVTAVKWVTRSEQQYTDVTGDVDLGNIDSLNFEPGLYSVEGDWGSVEIRSPREPEFLLD
ncbi:hypothetical protein [Rhodococcoides yunnanense]|uniref:hypothetical protein n=1 Tax=Rhodococcoides yunnanense TaxID=278209 RepID=UPI0009348A8E|nr:hypothetical protein [Rhodococcus yunnanensis]